MNAVATGLGADVNDGIALAGGLGIKNLVAAHQPESKSVHERIGRVARFKLGFAAEIRHAEAVAVRGNPTNYSFQDGMIFVDFSLRRPRHPRLGGCRTGIPTRRANRAKTQRIHYRYWPRAHSENVTKDASDSGRGTLKWLDKGRMVVRLDFECACPAVTDINDSRVLAGALNHAPATCRQTLQMHP